MRFSQALLCSVLVLFCVGCAFNPSSRSSSQDNQTQNTGGNPPPAPAPSAQYLYSANGLLKTAPTGSISAFKIDAITGALAEVSGSPFGSGPQPYNLATDAGHNLYLANPTLEGNNLRVFPITSTTGALGSPVLSYYNDSNYEGEQGCCPGPVVVDKGGRTVYIGNTENSKVNSYLVYPGQRLIEFGQVGIAEGHFPSQLVMNDDSNLMLVLTDAGAPTSLLYTVFRDDYSGAIWLAAGNPYTFSVANAVAFSADDHYVYVIDNPPAGATLHVLYIGSSAALKEISSTVLDSSADALAIAVDPTGKYVAVAGSASDSVISLFRVNSDGTLKIVSTAGAPAWTAPSLAFDNTGAFLYASDDLSAQIFGFAIDRNSGTLTPVSGSPWHTGDQPHSLLVVQPK